MDYAEFIEGPTSVRAGRLCLRPNPRFPAFSGSPALGSFTIMSKSMGPLLEKELFVSSGFLAWNWIRGRCLQRSPIPISRSRLRYGFTPSIAAVGLKLFWRAHEQSFSLTHDLFHSQLYALIINEAPLFLAPSPQFPPFPSAPATHPRRRHQFSPRQSNRHVIDFPKFGTGSFARLSIFPKARYILRLALSTADMWTAIVRLQTQLPCGAAPRIPSQVSTKFPQSSDLPGVDVPPHETRGHLEPHFSCGHSLNCCNLPRYNFLAMRLSMLVFQAASTSP